MNTSSYIDTSTVSYNLNLTNPKITAFYQSNPHIDFEQVNIFFIDLFTSIGCKQISPLIEKVESAILYPEDQKIKELVTFITNLRDITRKLIQSVSTKYVIAKTEYVREFKSNSLESDPRELFAKTNQSFFEKACSLLSIIFRIQVSNIGEKVKVILHQFNKILIANTDQIFTKQDITAKTEEYIHNFESNSTHMIHAIIQLLSECTALYEARVNQMTETVKKREDPTFTGYYKLIYELNDIIHQLPQSNDDPENALSFEHLLSQTFTTASISKDHDSNNYILMREDKPEIYIETQDVREHNIGILDVKSFLKRAIDKNTNSILISQYTGITSKPNYHIEIHNNIVVIYLHKLHYCAETLQNATDMIDSISSKLTDFCSLAENKYSIPKDILDGINREYQQFIMQKETIITGFKEQQKMLLTRLDDMRFGTLDKYLSTRYSSCKKQGYNCDMCNNFSVGTLKGLAAHKRGCARKMQKPFLDQPLSYDTETLSK